MVCIGYRSSLRGMISISVLLMEASERRQLLSRVLRHKKVFTRGLRPEGGGERTAGGTKQNGIWGIIHDFIHLGS